jgi:hypothetical protein
METEDLLAELLQLVDKDVLKEKLKTVVSDKPMKTTDEWDSELSPEESRSVIALGDENVKDQPWSKLHEPEVVGIKVDREDDDVLMAIQSKFKCYSTGVETLGVDPFNPEECRIAEEKYDPEEAKRCRKAMFEATIRKDVGFQAKPVTVGGIKSRGLSKPKNWSKSTEPQEELLREVHVNPVLENKADEAEREAMAVESLQKLVHEPKSPQSGQIFIEIE